MFPKMDDQIPKIKSKRQVLQPKPPLFSLQTLMMGLLVFFLIICSVKTATCPPSIPSSAATTTEQCTFDLYFVGLESKFILSSILCSFLTYTSTYTAGRAVGPVSNSLYYLYRLQPEKKRYYLNLA